MGIGVSVFLLAVGGVLAFAVTDSLNNVDLTAVGYIVMAAGAVGLIWSIYLTSRVTSRRAGDVGVVREERVVRDRDVY